MHPSKSGQGSNTPLASTPPPPCQRPGGPPAGVSHLLRPPLALRAQEDWKLWSQAGWIKGHLHAYWR